MYFKLQFSASCQTLPSSSFARSIVYLSIWPLAIHLRYQRTWRRPFGWPWHLFFCRVGMIFVSILFVVASSCNSDRQYWHRSINLPRTARSVLSSAIALFCVYGAPGWGGSMRSWQLASCSAWVNQKGPTLPAWNRNDLVSPSDKVRWCMPSQHCAHLSLTHAFSAVLPHSL